MVAACDDRSQIDLIEPELVDHLVLLGVLQDSRLTGSSTRRVALVGEPTSTVARLIEPLRQEGFIISPGGSTDEEDQQAKTEPVADSVGAAPTSPDITVWLRRRLGPQSPPSGIHLAVDTGNHHTIVLGPLVVPGVTACSNCLDVRIGHRWPTITLPDQTKLEQSTSLLAALISLHLKLAFEGRSPLLNGTSAFNTETGAAVNEPLLKTALCQECARPTNGKIQLPWESS